MKKALLFDPGTNYLLAGGSVLLTCSRLPASQKTSILCDLRASSEAGGEIPFFHNR
jgi:hypothetical protein